MDAENSDDDPEFSREMVRILTKELKLAKKQLRELPERRIGTVDSIDGYAAARGLREDNLRLQEENARLQAENHRLTISLRAQEENTDVKGILMQKTEEDILRWKLEAAEEERAQLLKERNKLIQERDEGANVDKGKKYKQKYLRYKEETSTATSQLREELNKAKTERETALSKVLQLELENQKLTPFEPSTFINNVVQDNVNLQSIKSFACHEELRIPENARDLLVQATPHQFCDGDSIIWLGTSRSQFLVFEPLYFYDPQGYGRSEGGFRPFHHVVGSERQRRDLEGPADLFYRQADRTWRYYGIFEFAGSRELCRREVEALGRGLGGMTEHVYKRTVMSRGMVAPNLQWLIRHMYSDGVLAIRCIGYRRVGFNQQLLTALDASTSVLIPTPGQNTSKRGSKRKDPPNHSDDKQKFGTKRKK